jgi:hypothetical protein
MLYYHGTPDLAVFAGGDVGLLPARGGERRRGVGVKSNMRPPVAPGVGAGWRQDRRGGGEVNHARNRMPGKQCVFPGAARAG